MQAAVRKIGELASIFDGSESDVTAVRTQAYELTEEICARVARELNTQGFSSSDSNFLQDHLQYIMEEICDPQIKNLPPIYDYGF